MKKTIPALIALMITFTLIHAQEFSWTFDGYDDFANGTFINTQAINGYLELSSDLETLRYLWVANAGEGSVSKIDTVLNKEVGRYWTGSHPMSGTDSPSRTAVDSYGNVWVGNRLGDRSIVKIAGHPSYCVDRDFSGTLSTSYDANNDGLIQTGEMRGWRQDECVILWRNLTTTPGYGPRAVAVDLQGYIWVGLYEDRRYLKLDPNTGNTIASINIGATPYGAIVDGNGFLWSANRGSNSITKINTATNTVVGTYPLRTSPTSPTGNPYGITIDKYDRVWVSMWGGNSGGPTNGVLQINSINPTQQTWYSIAGSTGRGITTDFNGNVWMADSAQSRLYKLVPSTTSYPADLTIGCYATSSQIGVTPIGVVTDGQGNIWVMSQASNRATKINSSDCSVIATVPTGIGPYTYSDATGAMLNQFIRIGTWTITLQNTDMLIWRNMSWDEWDNPQDNIIVEKRTLEEPSFRAVGSGDTFENISTGLVIRVTMRRNADDSSPKLDNLRIRAQGPIFCIGDGTINLSDRTVIFNFSSYPGHEYYLSNMIDSVAGLACNIDDISWSAGSSAQFNISGPDPPSNITIVPRNNWTASVSGRTQVNAYCEAPACYQGSSSTLFGTGNADVVLITDFSGSMKKAINSWDMGYTDNDCANIYSSVSPRKTHLAKCVDQELVTTVLANPGNRIWPVFIHGDAIDYYTGDPTNALAVNNYISNYGPQGTDKTCLACALNRAYQIFQAHSNPSRPKFVVLMTDGVPTHCARGSCTSVSDIYGAMQCEGFCDTNGMSGCGIMQGCDDSMCASAEHNTRFSADRLINDYRASIFTIAFGLVQECSRAQNLLSAIAADSGAEYHHSNNTQEIRQIYLRIAQLIASQTNITPVIPGPIARFTGKANLSMNYQFSRVCGNGIIEPGEQCEEASSRCQNCMLTYCGDGTQQMPNGFGLGGQLNDGMEQCDLGINGNPSDGCNDNCTFASVCGNSIREILEECDDGHGNNNDACTDSCLNARCGDGFLWTINCPASGCEQCDMGANNAMNENRCRTDCTVPYCGDGIKDWASPYLEFCDDGANGYDYDGCSDDCNYTTTCGNGIVEGVEQCDMGILNNNFIPDRCRTNCMLPTCGDGIIDSGEQCDDGDSIDTGNGCLATCQIDTTIETGFCGDGIPNNFIGDVCDDGPLGSNLCTPWCEWTRCGDGILHQPSALSGMEECDDGNRNNTDFCSDSCKKQCVWVRKSTLQETDFKSIALYDYVRPVFSKRNLAWTTEGANQLNPLLYPYDVVKVIVPPGFIGTEQINLTARNSTHDAKMCFNFTVLKTPSYDITEPDMTRVLVSKGKMINGYFEDELTGEFQEYGPYIIIVKVWER